MARQFRLWTRGAGSAQGRDGDGELDVPVGPPWPARWRPLLLLVESGHSWSADGT